VSLLFKSISLACCLIANTGAEEPSENRALINFNITTKWPAINDSVMGGVSESQFNIKNGSGFFTGNLSLANNGGFASVRHSLKSNSMTAKTTHINLKVKGDGRTYQFRIRDNENNGIAYKFDFTTVPNEWLEIKIPIISMKSSFRGRHMPEFIAPSADKVSQVSFLIADKKPGAFSLEVKSVSFN
jgi:monofunctional biosynthetic peptidoglycan transglycosylase